MNIKLLKWIDALVGRSISICLPAAKNRQVSVDPGRFLVIRPGGIGDAVLLIPALLALKDYYPEAEITVLAERRNCAAFALCPVVDGMLRYDVPSELLKAMRGGFDVVIDTEQWHRLSAVVARLTGAPVSIGFATNDRQRLFTHRVDYSHEQYEAYSFIDLLAPLGITPPKTLRVPFLAIPKPAAGQAVELLAPLAGKKFVAIFAGASIAERRWGGERFASVARALAAYGVSVVVVGGSDDAAEGDLIVAMGGGLNLAGKTSLAETAAVIARAALLLSGDSGVLHLAVGLGIPTVSLFGPGIEDKWGPKGEGDRIINRHFPCSPCTLFGTTPACHFRGHCLSEITPQAVTDAVKSQLVSPPTTPSSENGETAKSGS
jgi:heptosyltransferase II